IQTTGEDEFSEVFFQDAHIPADAVLGEIGGGWRTAMTTLSSERLSGRHRYHRFHHLLNVLATRLAELRDSPLYDSWVVELGRRYADIEAMRPLILKAESVLERGGDGSTLSSVAKLWWPVAFQDLCDLAMRIAAATPFESDDPTWY